MTLGTSELQYQAGGGSGGMIRSKLSDSHREERRPVGPLCSFSGSRVKQLVPSFALHIFLFPAKLFPDNQKQVLTCFKFKYLWVQYIFLISFKYLLGTHTHTPFSFPHSPPLPIGFTYLVHYTLSDSDLQLVVHFDHLIPSFLSFSFAEVNSLKE